MNRLYHPNCCVLVLVLFLYYHPLDLFFFISHTILCMFQCHSPKSTHPRPLLQSSKVCSIHLCLFCYLAYRVIVTIFLNPIYMRQYTVLVFFVLVYFTLYNRLQFHTPHQNFSILSNESLGITLSLITHSFNKHITYNLIIPLGNVLIGNHLKNLAVNHFHLLCIFQALFQALWHISVSKANQTNKTLAFPERKKIRIW